MPNTAKWKITVIDNFGAGRSIDFHLFTEEEMKEYREQIGDEPGPYDFYDGFELASVVGEFEEFLYGMADDLCGCDVTISKNEEEVAKFSIENDGTIVDCDCLSDDVIPVEDGEIAVDGPGSETIIKEYRINDETPYGAVLLQKENGEWYSEFEIPENEKLDLQTFRIIVTTNRIINNFDHDDNSEDNFVTGLIINGQKAELGYNYSSDDNRQLIWYKKNNDNLLQEHTHKLDDLLEQKKKLYLIVQEDDPEHTYGLFERKEDARFVCDSVSEDFACLIVKEYETDKKPANNVYYFVVNERRYTMDNNCFVSKEDTLEYIKKMGLIDHFEIHGHKLNSIDSGKDSIDENGNIIKPNDEDLEYSFYNLVPLLKEKRIEFEYFEQDYMDEAKLQK